MTLRGTLRAAARYLIPDTEDGNDASAENEVVEDPELSSTNTNSTKTTTEEQTTAEEEKEEVDDLKEENVAETEVVADTVLSTTVDTYKNETVSTTTNSTNTTTVDQTIAEEENEEINDLTETGGDDTETNSTAYKGAEEEVLTNEESNPVNVSDTLEEAEQSTAGTDEDGEYSKSDESTANEIPLDKEPVVEEEADNSKYSNVTE